MSLFILLLLLQFNCFRRCQARCRYNEQTGEILFENLQHAHSPFWQQKNIKLSNDGLAFKNKNRKQMQM